MINIVSNNAKTVTFDDFRKIGKGKISPFATIKVPDQHAERKQTILNNLF